MFVSQVVRSASALAGKTDAQLLALTYEKNDHDAFGVFYRRHQQALLGFVARSIGNRDLAQDIVAESFAIAFSKIDRFDSDLGSGRQWLFGIARVAMLARSRVGGRESAARGRLRASVTEGDHSLEAAEARIDSSLSPVVAGLDELSERERHAVVERVIEEREYSEIAKRQESSEIVVRQRVSRGLRKLARFVSGGPR